MFFSTFSHKSLDEICAKPQIRKQKASMTTMTLKRFLSDDNWFKVSSKKNVNFIIYFHFIETKSLFLPTVKS